MAQDSGKVVQFSTGKTKQTRDVTALEHQACTCLSLDKMTGSGDLLLSCGGQSQVSLLKLQPEGLFKEQMKLRDLSDNVSCLKTIEGSQSEKLLLICTFNGRLNLMKV